jgi:type II secretory pathway pseudopilin PulG
VVLALIGILATVGVTQLVPKQGPAVKAMVNSLYGALSEARSLARASGQPVALTTSGTGTSITINYGIATFDAAGNVTGIQAGGPTGTYSVASDGYRVSGYAFIDAGDASGVTGTPTLQTALTAANAGPNLGLSGTVWSTYLFPSSGATTTTFYFLPSGQAARDFHVNVVGGSNGLGGASSPVGSILVTSTGTIYRYYKPTAGDSTSSWKRL